MLQLVTAERRENWTEQYSRAFPRSYSWRMRGEPWHTVPRSSEHRPSDIAVLAVTEGQNGAMG